MGLKITANYDNYGKVVSFCSLYGKGIGSEPNGTEGAGSRELADH